MNKYESVIIIKPDIDKEETSKVVSNIRNKISEYANINKEEDLGIKKLAYEVKKYKEGHYLCYEFEIKEDKKELAIREIERFYRITDEIMKFITVREE